MVTKFEPPLCKLLIKNFQGEFVSSLRATDGRPYYIVTSKTLH